MQHSKWEVETGELKWREEMEREEAEAKAREAGCVVWQECSHDVSRLIRFVKEECAMCIQNYSQRCEGNIPRLISIY